MNICKHWLNPDPLKHDILVQVGEVDGKQTVWIIVYGGQVIFRHPTAVKLAIGFIDHFQPIQPLLDWAMEHIELSGRFEWEKWVTNPEWHQRTLRIVLQRMICAVTNQEEPV